MECLFFFPYFSRAIEIRLSHASRFAWSSTLYEIFKKTLTFECLCFPINIPYYGESLFPCFKNCLDSRGKPLQIHACERYGHSDLFPMNWGEVFPNFLKNPQPGNYMAFQRIFTYYGNLCIPIYGNCMSFH